MHILITEVSVPSHGIKKVLEEKDKNASEDRGWNFQKVSISMSNSHQE